MTPYSFRRNQSKALTEIALRYFLEKYNINNVDIQLDYSTLSEGNFENNEDSLSEPVSWTISEYGSSSTVLDSIMNSILKGTEDSIKRYGQSYKVRFFRIGYSFEIVVYYNNGADYDKYIVKEHTPKGSKSIFYQKVNDINCILYNSRGAGYSTTFDAF